MGTSQSERSKGAGLDLFIQLEMSLEGDQNPSRTGEKLVEEDSLDSEPALAKDPRPRQSPLQMH